MPLNRRAFMAATLTTSLLAQANVAGSTTVPEVESDFQGRTKADLPTPALLVDLDLFEANLKTMADHCKRTGCNFRPHAKTHKCPEIAKRQVASGALGVCVATVPEAEAMVAAGIKGVLLTSPIVEPGKLARMVELARQGGEVLLAIGHPRQAA